MNLTALSQESGVSASTLKNYYDVLVTTFVGFWMRPYGGPTRKRLLTTPRFFYFDLGVRNAAAALLPDARLAEADGPALFEQWVAIELRARAGYLGRGYDVSFWRTVSGAEVDFVWQAPREDVPVEVKWTERPRPEDAATSSDSWRPTHHAHGAGCWCAAGASAAADRACDRHPLGCTVRTMRGRLPRRFGYNRPTVATRPSPRFRSPRRSHGRPDGVPLSDP